ncbi:MAG: hypothetical protein HY916_09010 [Desulfovibrio sp.]|jgi:hypothetical protein|nr:hypothetical protein [Desulfovibrio sp.]
MKKGSKGLQVAGALALAGVVVLGAGPGLAAEYEIRMPVEKTARISPPPDAPAEPAKEPAKAAPKTALGRAAEAAAANADTAPKAASKPAPKPESGKSEPAVQAADKPARPAKSPEASAAKPASKARKNAKPAAAVSADPDAAADEGVVHVPSGAPIPVPGQPSGSASGQAEAVPAKPAPKPETRPAAKPEPKLDPKASVMPPAAAAAPIGLPADGQWVGEIGVEFQTERIILRATTNAEVERVTWFNVSSPSEPRKLAIDLRGPWRKKGPAVVRFDTGPVKAVVVGEHPDRLRLAVEFRDGAVAPSLDPVLEKGPAGVSLVIPLAVRLVR